MHGRQFHFGKSQPGPFAEFVEVYVEAGRLEAEAEANPARRDGALDGLRICEEMRNGEVIDFELVAITMRGIHDTNKGRYNARDLSHSEYKRHEIATGQVALCYHLLQIAHGVHYEEIYNHINLFFTDGRHDPRSTGDNISRQYYELAARIPADSLKTTS